MQRQLEQIIVAATLAFLLGCHAGLSKLLPLIPALILAALFLLLLATPHMIRMDFPLP